MHMFSSEEYIITPIESSTFLYVSSCKRVQVIPKKKRKKTTIRSYRTVWVKYLLKGFVTHEPVYDSRDQPKRQWKSNNLRFNPPEPRVMSLNFFSSIAVLWFQLASESLSGS